MESLRKGLKRAPKFTPKEEEILFQIICSYKDVVDNNRIDALSQMKKKDAWDEIALQFNEMSSRKRSAQSLRDKFSNTKKRKRARTLHGTIKTEEDDGFVDGLSSMSDEQKRDAILDIIGVPSPSENKEEKNPQGKEKRQPNFSPKEEEFLIHLVSLHKNIIESKRTDTATLSSKKAAWEKITKEFNTLSPQLRSVNSLKDKWSKIKSRLRDAAGETQNTTVEPVEMKSEDDNEVSMESDGPETTGESFSCHQEELQNLTPEEKLHELRVLLLQEDLRAKRELYRLQIEEKKRDMEMKEELHQARLENLANNMEG